MRNITVLLRLLPFDVTAWDPLRRDWWGVFIPPKAAPPSCRSQCIIHAQMPRRLAIAAEILPSNREVIRADEDFSPIVTWKEGSAVAGLDN